MGAAFLVQSPLARAFQDQILVNLGQLTGNGLTLVGACFAQMMVLHILHSPGAAHRRVRTRVVVALAALAALAVLFVLNPVGKDQFTTSAVPGSTTPPGIVAYYVVFLVYLGSALLDLLILLVRYVRRARDPYLRVGLRLIIAGCGLGLFYTPCRATLILLGLRSRDFPDSIEFAVGVIIPSVAVLLVTLGVTYGKWVELIQRPVRALAQWWAYHQLAPLWEAARATRPSLVLEVGGPRIGLRLYRRIVEIQDAQLLINASLDSTVRPAAAAAVASAGLVGRDAAATVEAAVFAAGLPLIDVDHRSAHVPVADTTAPSPARPDPRPVHDDDLVGTTQHLVRVARAYRRSPLVRRIASDIESVGAAQRVT